jgi:transposase
MCQELKRKEGPKHYARISTKVINNLFQRRQSLVDLVIEKGYSIGRAAVRLKIKLSTAKMIVKKYKEHGRFFEKKFVSRIRPKTSAQPT